MREDESLRRAINEGVTLVPYDPAWPSLFAAERDRLLALFPQDFIDMQHFGSTAVPGMHAKPVIDILAGVTSMADADRLVEPLCRYSYALLAELNAKLTDRRWLMRWANGRRTHHLHIVVYGGEQWRRNLQFRDALRSDPGIAARYAKLKNELVKRYAQDRDSYTNAKTEFILSLVGGQG